VSLVNPSVWAWAKHGPTAPTNNIAATTSFFMTSALPTGSPFDTGGVAPVEALFGKGWPATATHFLPRCTRRC
jgi:hypothetical protein